MHTDELKRNIFAFYCGFIVYRRTKWKKQLRNQSHLLRTCLFFEIFTNAKTALVENFRHMWKQSHRNKCALLNVFIGSPHKTYWLMQRPDYSYELCVLKSTAASIKWIYVFVGFHSFSFARILLLRFSHVNAQAHAYTPLSSSKGMSSVCI